MMKKALSLVVLSALANNAVALDAQFIKFSNGLTLTPTLEINQRYDDNIRNTPSDKKSSWSTVISPSFSLKAQERSNIYSAHYKLTHNRVSSYSDDNTTDHKVGARADIALGSYDKMNVYIGYNKNESRRDSTNNLFNESGNKSHTTSLGGSYTLVGSKGELVFDGNYRDLRYDNNYRTGSRTREKEYSNTNFGTTLYYPIALKTDLLAEIRLLDFNYRSNKSLDSNSYTYHLGARWEAAAKLITDIRFGREQKKFDAKSQKDVGWSSWVASVEYLPLTYSSLTFESKRYISEGSFSEQYIKRTASTISWDHDWGKYLSYITSSVDYTRRNVDYKGGRNNGRRDDIDDFVVKLTYDFRRWMDISLDYRYTNTDSNQDISDYDRRVIGLSIDASL